MDPILADRSPHCFGFYSLARLFEQRLPNGRAHATLPSGRADVFANPAIPVDELRALLHLPKDLPLNVVDSRPLQANADYWIVESDGVLRGLAGVTIEPVLRLIDPSTRYEPTDLFRLLAFVVEFDWEEVSPELGTVVRQAQLVLDKDPEAAEIATDHLLLGHTPDNLILSARSVIQ